MPLPFLPLKPTSTSGVLDEPDLVGLIVEQVAAGNPAEACRLAVRWCGLTRGHRAQCNANSGELWMKLAQAVFPTARKPAPVDEAYGYKPKDDQSKGKEWFYHLCTRSRVMKEHEEMFWFAKIKAHSPHNYDTPGAWGSGSPILQWYQRLGKWKEWHHALAALDQKVHGDSASEAQEDALRRRQLNGHIDHAKEHMDVLMQAMQTESFWRKQLYVVDAQMRLEIQREYMADLFPDRGAPEPDPQSVQVHEAYSKLRKETLALLDTPAFIGLERKLWKQRIGAMRRSVADRDAKDPREAELTALIQEVESHFDDTHLRKPTEINNHDPARKAVLDALYKVKYHRYGGWTFASHERELANLVHSLERARSGQPIPDYALP